MQNLSAFVERETEDGGDAEKQELLEKIASLQKLVADLQQQKIEEERDIKLIYLRDAEKMRREFDAALEKKNQANDNTRDVYERRIAFTVEQAKADVKEVKQQLEKFKQDEFDHLEEILTLKANLEERDLKNKELKSELEHQTREISRRDEMINQLRNESQSHSILVDDKMKRVEAELEDMKEAEVEELKKQIREKTRSGTSDGPNKYLCKSPGCGKAFRDNSALSQHERIHLDIKPFSCTSGGVKKPSVQASGNASNRKCVCKFVGCDRSFDRDKDLARHERIHLNIKPYICTWPDCKYASTQRPAVVQHIRMVHFKLPESVKKQNELNIEDDRDPNEFVRVDQQLANRRL